MKRQFLILLLLFPLVQPLFGQSINSYKLDFIGAASKPVVPIYVFNETSYISYFKEPQKQPLSYRRIIVEKSSIILAMEDFNLFQSILNDLLKIYSTSYNDSSFNTFVISKEYSPEKIEKKEISRFNESVGTFYVTFYKKLKENRFPDKLLETIRWHITFLEEQEYGKKILEE